MRRDSREGVHTSTASCVSSAPNALAHDGPKSTLHAPRPTPFAPRPTPHTPRPSWRTSSLTQQYARRTPMTRAKKGGFRDTSADGLLYKLLKAGIAESGVDPKSVQDVIAGEWCWVRGTGWSGAVWVGNVASGEVWAGGVIIIVGGGVLLVVCGVVWEIG